MNKRNKIKYIILSIVLFLGISIGQDSYIAQKLMIENNIRSRIESALSKIVDEYKYVINVDVELEISDEVNEQVTLLSPRDKPAVSSSSSEYNTHATLQRTEQQKTKNEKYSVGLPIPGFEIEMTDGDNSSSDSKESVEEIIVIEQEGQKVDSAQDRYDVVKSRRSPSRAEIKQIEISLILQEGAAPELIENIRQLTMAAAKFDRKRGDKLTIMTASFKERRDQRSAETILLKNIAEKIELLENKRTAENSERENNWREELQQYRDEEAARITSVEKLLQGEIEQFKTDAREKAREAQKETILKEDSIQVKALNDEIATLKEKIEVAQKVREQEQIQQQSDRLLQEQKTDSQLKAKQLTRIQKLEKLAEELLMKEKEKASKDSLIKEKLTAFESMEAELDQFQKQADNSGPDTTTLLLALVGGLALILLVILIIVISKSKQPPVPPWMYPPPRRRPKKKNKKKAEEPSAPVEIVAAPVPPPTQVIPPVEDASVLQSEVNDIRKSVISLSVGQPGKTTQIVKDWMDAPAPPEPVVEVPAPEESEDEKKKNKKKKKK
ncbi:MAG: hypothetical protein HN657_05730 [Candidatus Marinimicrobia bacterium]|jgi:hypothetical protein|nr:hypothetical protein [Candidatus Neomarinimicrobiota bacterium]MBT6158952.1 hypothetical protein [Candidatus Neomarinimicrobiota bacterium]MBT7357690.1 hypothetical protein [Candidatus Neomarinimicrobiota bacterium]MBT7513691.1 hypothetical protein [Candidatus Neomarinimicrobiota bacterium]